MKRFIKTISIAFIVAIIAGCATIPETLTHEEKITYKRIGVVSVTAETLYREHVGMTMFTNQYESMDISSWDIDSKYEQQMAKVLSSVGGVEALLGPSSRPELQQIKDLSGHWKVSAWVPVEKPIRSYCSSNKVDAILIAFADKENDFIGGTNQYVQGAGLYSHGGFSSKSVLHLISGVALVDCQKAQPVAIRSLASTQEGMLGTILGASPIAPIPEGISDVHFNGLSKQQLDQIRTMLETLPVNAWAPTIHALFGK